MMIISAIIARIVIEKRKREDEFWTETFGDSDHDGDSASKSKEEYHSWVRKIEDGKPKKQLHKQKIKLEVIGGPPDAPGHLDEMYKDPTQSRKKHSNSTSKKKRGIHGKSCLWCDRGITAKYVKRCPDRRTKTERCSDGPFCSEKCLNEHLDTVPHYQEANF